MKVLQITIYEVKNIDLHEFYKDIKKYCICENCQRKTENESEIKWEEEDYGIFTKKINK